MSKGGRVIDRALLSLFMQWLAAQPNDSRPSLLFDWLRNTTLSGSLDRLAHENYYTILPLESLVVRAFYWGTAESAYGDAEWDNTNYIWHDWVKALRKGKPYKLPRMHYD